MIVKQGNINEGFPHFIDIYAGRQFAHKLEFEQVYDPVETLFLVKRRASQNIVAFGFGDLRERFERGEALTTGPPKVKEKNIKFANHQKDRED